MTPVLAIERLTYAYPDAPAPALDDVTLHVEEGELIVLAGRSGSGKSTLLRLASGLVPHVHGGTVSGAAVVAGMDVRDHGPGELAAATGSLFQDPETQVVMGTVRNELAFPLENRGESPAGIARGVEEAALALGIAHLLERPTHALSGGELQRVALAAALVGRPQLVLLDEPTSQLDPVAGDELIGLLRRLNEEWGTTVLLAEHRLERCLTAADRVIAMADGRIACDADPQRFLAWAHENAPALETPGARLLARVGLGPAPVGVKQARAVLRSHGALPSAEGPALLRAGPDHRLRRRCPSGCAHTALTGGAGASSPPPARSALAAPASSAGRAAARSASPASASLPPARHGACAPALKLRGVWVEPRHSLPILRGVDLSIAPGERVALMGRNGAGKSTLLRHVAGLAAPTRGKIERSGRVALLLQNPNDYLVHERVGEEASADALAAVGLAHLADRHPRDLSGGERQRLALAIVLGGEDVEPPAVLCLDEPTRGMDRAHKADLAVLLGRLAATGTALLVATHDPEFAALVADRVVLLADGAPIADGAAADVLAGGWYFATETARILRGAGGALDPVAGAALVRAQLAAAGPPPAAAGPPPAAAPPSAAAPPPSHPHPHPTTEVRRR
jgi:energy-coupling factor transporter ATP-binding protein EcfA2